MIAWESWTTLRPIYVAPGRPSPDSTITEHLADVFFKKGKFEEAVTRWQDALQEWEISAPIDKDLDRIARIKEKLEKASNQYVK